MQPLEWAEGPAVRKWPLTGAGVAAHIKVFSGRDFAELVSVAPFGAYNGGMRVAVADVDGDGDQDIVGGAGPSPGGHVVAYDAASLTQIASFFAYDLAFNKGVFVG